MNRLGNQDSPYLLQHAANPIHWYPWSSEAFEMASQRNCPIFLSIGYSTCHWCHVMAEESFENQEIAEILNDHFISIKVDREERPDIDHVYMAACQAMNGYGGWPLTVICTPQGKPFFVGTYFPPTDQNGRPGLKSILRMAADKWYNSPSDLERIGLRITAHLNRPLPYSSASNLDKAIIDTALQDFRNAFDPHYGGFGSAPKFPTPHYILFLLRIWACKKEPDLQTMIETTLESMYRGGIFDHIGFGFCRYSTDNQWLVPHFEKMLYDNALLSMAYLEAYQTFKNENYRKIAESVFSYVLRDMQHPVGGFYSAQDADSEGVEGKFYLWDYQEVLQVLGEKLGSLFCRIYNISRNGNFQGTNIPNLIETPKQTEINEHEIEELRKKLFQVREKRPHPFRDDKILTSWNGLMIGALAKGARILRNGTYLEAAEKSIQFVFANLQDERGRLFARYRNAPAVAGFINDYAFLIWGLIELYEAAFNEVYLTKANDLGKLVLELFSDPNGPGFFFTEKDHSDLLVRPKEFYDGALPSGNSIMAWNLLRLHNYLPNENWRTAAEDLLKVMGVTAKENPMGYSMFLLALDYASYPLSEIKIAGSSSDPTFHQMIQLVNEYYLPHTILRVVENNASPHTEALVCSHMGCLAPITELSVLEETIR